MEDPTPPLDTPEVFGGVKTWLLEGPKYIELEPLGDSKTVRKTNHQLRTLTLRSLSPVLCFFRFFGLRGLASEPEEPQVQVRGS